MYEEDEAVGEAHAEACPRGVTLELEPVLIRLLLYAALHLLEGVAKAADARQEIMAEVEAQSGIARACCCHGASEILLVAALEMPRSVAQYIIIIWAYDVGIEGKEVAQKPLCLLVPFGIAQQGEAVSWPFLTEVLEMRQQDIERAYATVVEDNYIVVELVEGRFVSEVIAFKFKDAGRNFSLGHVLNNDICKCLASVVGIATANDDIILVGIKGHQLLCRGVEEYRARSCGIIDERIVEQGLSVPEGQDKADTLFLADLGQKGCLRGGRRAEEHVEAVAVGEQRLYLSDGGAAVPSIDVKADAGCPNAVCSHKQPPIELHHVLVAERQEDSDFQARDSGANSGRQRFLLLFHRFGQSSGFFGIIRRVPFLSFFL